MWNLFSQIFLYTTLSKIEDIINIKEINFSSINLLGLVEPFHSETWSHSEDNGERIFRFNQKIRTEKKDMKQLQHEIG